MPASTLTLGPHLKLRGRVGVYVLGPASAATAKKKRNLPPRAQLSHLGGLLVRSIIWSPISMVLLTRPGSSAASLLCHVQRASTRAGPLLRVTAAAGAGGGPGR